MIHPQEIQEIGIFYCNKIFVLDNTISYLFNVAQKISIDLLFFLKIFSSVVFFK